MDKVATITRVRELVQLFRTAMLTAKDPQSDELKSRPLAVHDIDDDGVLWFFTTAGAQMPVAGEVRAVATFVDGHEGRFMAITGVATMLDDPAKEHELWTPNLRAFFPEGVDAPDLVLVRLHVELVEYWDSPTSPLEQVVGFVKAAVSGQAAWHGRHECIQLPH